MKKAGTQLVSAAFAWALFLSIFAGTPFTASADTVNKSAPSVSMPTDAEGLTEAPYYRNYYEEIQAEKIASSTAIIDAVNYAQSQGDVSVTQSGSLITGSDSSVEWNFSIKEQGLYNLTFLYFPTVSKGGTIERNIYIDGKLPFKEAAYVNFSRVYRDAYAEFKRDGANNDLRPEQKESARWITYTLRDSNEHVRENFKIYLSQGEHTITMEAAKEALELDEITFSTVSEPDTYEQYINANSSKSTNQAEMLWVEAEKPFEKSSFTIYPLFDKKSSATYPQDPIKIRLNTIGGSKWAYPGQWLTWEIDVKHSGYYNIAPRYRQDAFAGGYVSRRLLIDGECPFKEAQSIRFNYTDRWKIKPLGDAQKDYKFFLKEGKHTITMSVVLGDMADVIDRVDAALYSLNEDYRRILMLTGPSPDIYRDYGFEQLIPDVLQDLNAQADELRSVIEQLKKETNIKGDYTVQLNKMVIILDKIKNDPEKLSELFRSFKDNLAALGTWLQTARQQPLEFDRIYLIPTGQKMPDADNGLADNVAFQVKAFFLSFFEDYRSMATNITAEDIANKNVVKVWISSGRDQSQILQQMADQNFTNKNGIKVNLQLVTPAALLPSVLAGIGPDVSLSTPTTDPINFAIRGAVMDLNRFPDLNEVLTRFNTSALAPFTFNDKVYALPETQSFPMLFYRTDIFEKLGLEAPRTWSEFYNIIPVLQKQNMTVGFPVNAKPSVISNANLTGLNIFLYQKGGTLYNNDFTRSNMSEDVNVDAFQEMTNLFTLYKFPVDFDFANRFRSGEMPMGIVDYPMYNQLTVFAPEIKGLWAMAPIPGTVQADGSINNTSPSGGLGVVMLRNADSEEKAWEFMKWWTSEETQSSYAIELESVLGPAAKHPTANINALKNLAWTAKEYAALSAQMKNLTGTPEIPGGYYSARAIDFAFSTTYTNKDKAVSALLDNIKAINDEITRKRHEFGLE